MNTQTRIKTTILASLLVGGCLGLFAANKPGYVVKPSLIVPEWSGATPGVWTMDYASALANASADGKWTLMLYSGMWWCPHCQPLEEHVLTKPAFSNYVAECGYYTTVLDNPYRDGYSNWCWLYETNYVENVAGLTMEEALQEIDKRYAVQESYALPGATEYNISNWNGTATITYHKVGYPTIIVIRPDGNPAGRFTFSRNIASDIALTYVTNLIEQAKCADEWDEVDNYWQTTKTLLAHPENPDEFVLHGDHTLATRDTADWFKIESGDQDGCWTFLFDEVPDRPGVVVTASFYDDPTADPIAEAEVDVSARGVFSAETFVAGTYYLKVSVKSLDVVAGYRLSYLVSTGRGVEFGAGKTLVSTEVEHAMPTLYDIDGDGLLDLLVGVKEPLAGANGVLTGYVGRVRVYGNAGTDQDPRFDGYSYLTVNGEILEESLDRNSGCQGLKAAFGDFDGDGYDDLFVGHHWGELDVYWGTDDLGVYSGNVRILERPADMQRYRTYPCARDFDGDGRAELYVGCIEGVFLKFTCDGERNISEGQVLDDGAGNMPKATASRSAPAFADVTGDGLVDLLSGDMNGNILLFPAIGIGRWSAQSKQLLVGQSGSRSRIDIADLNGDGVEDIVVGYANGTVALMSGMPGARMTCEPDKDGYVPGLAIDPIDVVIDTAGEVTAVNAKNLPSGLALKKDSVSGVYQICGTPTKPCTNDVTLQVSYTTGGMRKSLSTTVQIRVLPLPVLAIDVEEIDGGEGRVNGAGSYLAGKKVTLSATADTRSKSVFAGWYVNGSPFEGGGADHRSTSIQVVMPPVAELRLTARFVPSTEDSAVAVYFPDTTLRAGEQSGPLHVQSDSISFPTVSAKGLPTGLKLDAKSLTISGVPTKPGDYEVVFAVKNASRVSDEYTAHIKVLNFASAAIAPLDEMYSFAAGIVETNMIEAVVDCSVSGLPSGMKFDKTTGTIYGAPSKPGMSLVTFTKKIGKTTEKASTWFYVAGAGVAPDGTDGIPVVAQILSSDGSDPMTNGIWRIDLTQGVEWRCAIGSVPTLLDLPVSYSVKSLPTGLKFDSKTGVISGAPTRVSAVDSRSKEPKPTIVSVTASNKAKWSGSVQFEIYVFPRPAWAAGTFDGVASLDGTNGLFTLTLTDAGAASGKYMIGGKSYSFKTASIAKEEADGSFGIDVPVSFSRTYIVTNRLVLSEAVYEAAAMTGIAEDMTAGRINTAEWDVEGFNVTNACQNLWLRKDANAYRLPVFATNAQQSFEVIRGNLTFRFSAKGRVSVSGKIDGKSVSGSFQLLATDFGIPACHCDTSFYYNGLIPVSLPNQDYFSIVTFMGSSDVPKITGREDAYDMELTADDQVVE